MEKHSLKPYDSDRIIKNIDSVFAKKDISILEQKSYEFLMLMSGFIAHYNIHGFIYAYQDLRYLIHDILASRDTSDPDRYINDKFFENSYGLDYCISKTKILRELGIIARKYKAEIDMQFMLDESSREIMEATKLAEKNGYKLVKA